MKHTVAAYTSTTRLAASLSRTGMRAVVGIIVLIVEEKSMCKSHCITAYFIVLFLHFSKEGVFNVSYM
jgi:hypothetical protein